MRPRIDRQRKKLGARTATGSGRRRPAGQERTPSSLWLAGFTLIEVLVAVSILSIIATLILPNLLCTLEKGRVTRSITDVLNARKMVEIFLISNGVPPPTLEAAYGSGHPPPLIYCGDSADPDAGHGNDCDFSDEGNPSGNSPAVSTPANGYVVRTERDLAPGCQQVDFVWATCCGGRPLIVAQGEWTGRLPGGSGGGGGGGKGGGGGGGGKGGGPP